MIYTIVLGTYTRRESKGIYRLLLDTAAEKLTDLQLLAEETSPTYLTKSRANNWYTVTTKNGKGGAASYDTSFHFLNAITEDGAPLCYVSVDEDRQLVYGANYHKGELTIYKIQTDGSLELRASVFHEEPTGPHKNQDHAHVHYTDLTPDRRLAVCDLGTDRVYTYNISENGDPTRAAVFVAEAGTGPRHLVFHPQKDLAYLVGELDNSITLLSYDRTDGSFAAQQKVSTLPADFTGESSGAAIRISQDGKFVYASNRGHNSIAVFAVSDTDGSLEQRQILSSEGDFPRDFQLSPDDHYLVCGNQNSDTATLYRRDSETGELTMIQKDVYAPESVCVYFDEKE